MKTLKAVWEFIKKAAVFSKKYFKQIIFAFVGFFSIAAGIVLFLKKKDLSGFVKVEDTKVNVESNEEKTEVLPKADNLDKTLDEITADINK